MEKLFILNPAANIPDCKDAMDEKFCKIRGILNCVIFALEFANGDDKLDHSSAYQALWAIDGFLDEVNCLRQKICESVQ